MDGNLGVNVIMYSSVIFFPPYGMNKKLNLVSLRKKKKSLMFSLGRARPLKAFAAPQEVSQMKIPR